MINQTQVIQCAAQRAPFGFKFGPTHPWTVVNMFFNLIYSETRRTCLQLIFTGKLGIGSPAQRTHGLEPVWVWGRALL